MHVNSSLNYTILERKSSEALQALGIEINFLHCESIICGVILYRQHNSPEQFQTYFDSTPETPICIMGDFNIDLFKSKSNDYSRP